MQCLESIQNIEPCIIFHARESKCYFLCDYLGFYLFWYLTFGDYHICPSEILNCLPKIPVNRNVVFCVIILDFYLLWYLTFGRFTTIFEQFIRFSEVLNILHKIHMNRNVAFCVIILDLYICSGLWYLTFIRFIMIFEQFI